MKLDGQAITAVGAVAFWAIGLSSYALLHPNLQMATPVASPQITTTLVINSEATPAAPVSTAEMPSPSSVPTLLGAPASTERETAKKMALLAGYLNEYWAQQFANDQNLKSHTWRPITELYVDADSGTCDKNATLKFGDYFCWGKGFVSLDVTPTEISIDKTTGELTHSAPPSTPARNFIISHEWGHAVEEATGVHLGAEDLELQADCYAGLFLKHALMIKVLSGDDINLSLIHASIRAIGDDAMQPIPGSEHGTGAQREASFDTGWNGNPASCVR